MPSWTCLEINCCIPNCVKPCFCFSPNRALSPTHLDSSAVSRCKSPLEDSTSHLSSSCCVRAHKHFLYSSTPSSQRTRTQNPIEILFLSAMQRKREARPAIGTTISSHFMGFLAETSTPQNTPTTNTTMREQSEISISMTSSPTITSPRSPSSTRLRSLSKLQIPRQPLLSAQKETQSPSPLILHPTTPKSSKHTPMSTITFESPASLSPSPFQLLAQHLLRVPPHSQVSPLSTTYMPRSGTTMSTTISPMSAGHGSTMGIAGSPFSGRTPFSDLGSTGGSPLAMSNMASPILMA
jgi:hypothetical protein